MTKPTESQLYYLQWLSNGGQIQSPLINQATKRVLIDRGWVTDDGDDLHLTTEGHRIASTSR